MGKKKKNNHFNLPTLAFTDEMEYLKGCLLLLISCFYLEMLLCMRSDACAVRAGAGERAGLSAVDLQHDYNAPLSSASVSSPA